MRELLRTNNLVLLSWADATMRGAGIDTIVLDGHVSAVEGSIGAFPRRLMVPEADHTRAVRLLEEAHQALDDG